MNKPPKKNVSKIIRPLGEIKKPIVNIEQVIPNQNKYSLYCIGLFLLFVLSCVVVSFIDMSCVIKFLIVLLSAIIIEDIHHTIKFVWKI